MRRFLTVVLFVVLISSLSPALFAQSDICEPPTPSVPSEQKVQLLQLQAEERTRRAAERANWVASILPVKYATSANSLRPLCVFGIEVAPQPTTRLVAIRAPKELMPSIEEALKRLDAPLPVAKSVELTAYVLVVSDNPEQGLQPLPSALQPVANQLKGILPTGTLYLADTVVVRGIDGEALQLSSTTHITTTASIREGAEPVVHLENLNVSTNDALFSTDVDVPIGAQVVVGKTGKTTNRVSGASRKAVVLVVTASILN